MSLIAKGEPKSDRVLISEGVHLGVCIGVYDLGTQVNKKYDKELHKVLISWEVPDERIKGEEKDYPMSISKQYTLSLHEKAILSKDLEAWLGIKFDEDTRKAGYDLHEILGKTCQLQIIHNVSGENTYANVGTIMALPKGTQELESETSLRFYSIEDELTDDIPEWIQNIIKKSKEYKDHYNFEGLPINESIVEEVEEVFGENV